MSSSAPSSANQPLSPPRSTPSGFSSSPLGCLPASGSRLDPCAGAPALDSSTGASATGAVLLLLLLAEARRRAAAAASAPTSAAALTAPSGCPVWRRFASGSSPPRCASSALLSARSQNSVFRSSACCSFSRPRSLCPRCSSIRRRHAGVCPPRRIPSSLSREIHPGQSGVNPGTANMCRSRRVARGLGSTTGSSLAAGPTRNDSLTGICSCLSAA